MPVPYLLYLYNDDPVKSRNWLLALNTADTPAGIELQRSFRMLCYLMPRDLKWFHQGGCLPNDEIRTWNAFEFWTPDQDPILAAVMEIAAELGLDLQLGMPSSDDYRALAA
jgi:hypothetical protein